MKALILLPSLGLGGSEKKSIRLVNELVKRGKSVQMAYLQGPTTLLSKIDPAVQITYLRRRGKFSFGALRRLQAIIVQEEITVVLCMNLYPLLYVMALKRWSSTRSFKVIVAINITDFERLRDRLAIYLYARLIRRTDAVVYGCEYQKTLWERIYGLAELRSLVIYNGVDTVFFDSTRLYDDLGHKLHIAESFIIGTVGRMDPEKNQASLLRVAAQLFNEEPNVDVLIAGSGNERISLETLAADLGIAQRVHFVGQMDDIRPVLSALDVFVLPSTSVETFSNATLEAMAMTVPVVISKVGGAAEMVVDNENGFLFERHDLSGLTTLIRRLRKDQDLRCRLGRKAREVVVGRFNLERMIDEYQALLQDV